MVTHRRLDEREPQDVAETLAYTAGASGGYRGENGVIEMSVRSIGNKSDGGSQPTYLNDLSYPASLEINSYVIDQIDVLKGPASVLYGQANPSGLVNLKLKEATGSDENEILLKAGTGNRLEAGVDIDRAITEQFAYRLVAVAKRMNWQEGKNTQQESYTLAPSFRWTPNPQTELAINALYEKQPKAGNRNFLVSTGTLTPVNGQYIGRKFFAGDPNFHDFNNEKAQIGYRFRHNFDNNISVHQNLRYGKYTDNWKTLVAWNADGNSSHLIRKARAINANWQDFQVDNRIQWQPTWGNTQHNWILGLDYACHKNERIADMADVAPINW